MPSPSSTRDRRVNRAEKYFLAEAIRAADDCYPATPNTSETLAHSMLCYPSATTHLTITEVNERNFLPACFDELGLE